MGGKDRDLLGRRLYAYGEAARLLGLQASKLRRWVDGAVAGGVRYEPVIRPTATGEASVTWGEFVEAGFLREYRAKGIPLQQLRPAIAALRRRFGSDPTRHTPALRRRGPPPRARGSGGDRPG